VAVAGRWEERGQTHTIRRVHRRRLAPREELAVHGALEQPPRLRLQLDARVEHLCVCAQPCDGYGDGLIGVHLEVAVVGLLAVDARQERVSGAGKTGFASESTKCEPPRGVRAALGRRRSRRGYRDPA
jgi:hypothetical protein